MNSSSEEGGTEQGEAKVTPTVRRGECGRVKWTYLPSDTPTARRGEWGRVEWTWWTTSVRSLVSAPE